MWIKEMMQLSQRITQARFGKNMQSVYSYVPEQ
jgi:hypothetical protein